MGGVVSCAADTVPKEVAKVESPAPAAVPTSPEPVKPVEKAAAPTAAASPKEEQVPVDAVGPRNFTAQKLIQPRVPERMQIVPFDTLAATFEDAVMLGEGGFGVVWEVNWKGTAVAVKKLNMTKKNAIAGDFIREVIVLGTMAHPNIVQLVGVSCDDGNRCLMYELMGGGSLADRLALSEEGGTTVMEEMEGLAGASEMEDFVMPFSWQDRIAVSPITLIPCYTNTYIRRRVEM